MGRGRRFGSLSSSGIDKAPQRMKNERREEYDDRDGGASGERGRQWRSHSDVDDQPPSASSPELRSRVRVEGSDRERNRDKDRAEYEERGRFEEGDSDRARHRYDPDRSRPEMEKRQRTETYRSNRDDGQRDRSHLRMEIGRERRKNDRDESRDYGRQVEGRDFSRVKDGEPGRNAEDSDIPPRARNKENSGIEDNREFVCRGEERESSREDNNESEVGVIGAGNEDDIKESSRARCRDLARSGEMSGSRYGREKERESPRRGYGSRNEPGRGRGKSNLKEKRRVMKRRVNAEDGSGDQEIPHLMRATLSWREGGEINRLSRGGSKLGGITKGKEMLRAKKMEPGNGERYANTEIIPQMRKKDL
ncbi:hypothetical protein R1flu_023494 [Riccia fluitans]|uniref:Uncharacterized protein n=1 Tax=Riccia fluitans TaxID=41844 RepID=A0ABD1XSB8_9MARC